MHPADAALDEKDTLGGVTRNDITTASPHGNTYANHNAYYMQTAEVQEGKTCNFAALIAQKSNPHINEIIAEFDETISILTNKP